MARKTEQMNTRGLASDAAGMIEELHGEIEEWRDNMESNNMEHLPKFDEVSEAADLLQEALDAAEGLDEDVIEALFGEDHTTEVTWNDKRRASRPDRRDVATAHLQALLDAVDQWIEDTETSQSDAEDEVVERIRDERGVDTISHEDDEVQAAFEKEVPVNEHLDDARNLRDEIETAIDQADQVEFPRMFG